MKTPLDGITPSQKARTLVVSGALLLTLSMAIAGCTPGSAPGNTDARPTSSSSPASSTPTATPTNSPGVPAGPPTTSTPASPTSAAGCAPNDAVVPAGADTSPIDDVDFDGRDDTQFFAEEPDFLYGISTASGATFMLRSDLAGPAKHSGWTATIESGLVITVLDDSRTATLHTFANCGFHTTTTPAGERLSISLTGGLDRQGVQCSAGNGGRWLDATTAARLESGLFTLSRSSVQFSPDGVTATITAPEQVATDVPADDPRIALATESRCGDTPKVATSGR